MKFCHREENTVLTRFPIENDPKQGLNAKEDKNREIGQDCAEQCASVVMWFMRAREQRHVDERVGLCIHTVSSRNM